MMSRIFAVMATLVVLAGTAYSAEKSLIAPLGSMAVKGAEKRVAVVGYFGHFSVLTIENEEFRSFITVSPEPRDPSNPKQEFIEAEIPMGVIEYYSRKAIPPTTCYLDHRKVRLSEIPADRPVLVRMNLVEYVLKEYATKFAAHVDVVTLSDSLQFGGVGTVQHVAGKLTDDERLVWRIRFLPESRHGNQMAFFGNGSAHGSFEADTIEGVTEFYYDGLSSDMGAIDSHLRLYPKQKHAVYIKFDSVNGDAPIAKIVSLRRVYQ